MREWLGKNDVLWYIPIVLTFTFKVDFLQRLKPLHDGSKKHPLGLPHKTSKILISQRPKTTSKTPLDEIGYNLREFVMHMAENIIMDFRSPQSPCYDC